nr:UPF0175 family protein [Natronomonas marina]
MPRTTSTIPEDLHRLVEGSVEAGIFENKSDAVRCVLREYFDRNEAARNAAAVHNYDTEDASLGTAARLADVSRSGMRTVLREHNVEIEATDEPESGAQDGDASDNQSALDAFDPSE